MELIHGGNGRAGVIYRHAFGQFEFQSIGAQRSAVQQPANEFGKLRLSELQS